MKINIVLPQKRMKSYYEEARKEYEKRLSRFAKIRLIRVKTEAAAEKHLHAGPHAICVHASGERITSEALAEKLMDLTVAGTSEITFVLTKGDEGAASLALTAMDVDRELLLVMLYEQLYRAYKIQNNESYHK